MERYHILKLGLAITFYAAYCARPMLVYGLEADNELDNNNYSNPDQEFFHYFQGVDGRPGIDFPVYSYIPRTSFSCKGIESGYYADLETDCQVFHICEDGRKISFLCPNGTIFQQSELICEWWNKVNCSNSPSLYEESAEKLQNDEARRKASRRVSLAHGSHGAVMRTEERTTVRVSSTGRRNNNNRQRTNNHKIPTNNDIEQQIEQAEESNNRHLANAQNLIQNSRKAQPQGGRPKQVKKDIDRDTGNYLNNNYDKNSERGSKKFEQGARNSFNFGAKTGSETTSSFKQYHMEFDSTTPKPLQSTRVSYSTSTTTGTYYYDPQKQTASTTTEAPSTTAPDVTTTTEKYPYGSGIKGRYNSFDAHPPQTIGTTSKPPSSTGSRGTIKYQTVNYNYENSAPITTYAPPLRQSTTFSSTDNYELPPFPKHKSEISGPPPQPQPSSFVKNTFNGVTTEPIKPTSSPYPNHRSTYSDLQNVELLQPPKVPSISSITPHLVTTQPINNGKPFVGSRVGNTIYPNQPTTHSKYTYLPTTKSTIIIVLRHETTTQLPPYGPPELPNDVNKDRSQLFNVGSTDGTLPPIETSTQITNALPTDIFNVGNTDSTLRPIVFPDIASTTAVPFNIYVPEEGSLNTGRPEDAPPAINYDGLQPVDEPPFIKKEVPLLYQQQNGSTERTVDHATVYGVYSTTTRAPAYSRNTPYSPTVPTVTQNSVFVDHSTAKTPATAFDRGVPIKFENGQDKISIHLSSNVGGSSVGNNNLQVASRHSGRTIGAVLHVQDNPPSTTFAPEAHGFFVTKGFDNANVPVVKSKIEKPRPFSKSVSFDFDNRENSETPSAFPAYEISSARPFEIAKTTTQETATAVTTQFVYNNVDNMIGVLQEIANFNSGSSGLEIPPSVSPQTLHSLAQYFANEIQNDTSNDVLEPDTKEKLTTLLTAMTVHGYNNLFTPKSNTPQPTDASTITPAETTTIAPSSFDGEDPKKSSTENDIADDNGDLLSTTSLPELRQLAKNFSLALSSYLNNPEMFRKSLEGLRPTEPPPLDGGDASDSNGNDDELLNFSDADVKPSTTAAAPSPTWGCLLVTDDAQEDVKNSLNPDLNTADSQSFVPRFNNLQVTEKEAKGFTNLPPDHWTTSPQATKLWQKELSVNPVNVNDQFEATTPGIAFHSTEAGEDTTEPELYHSETAPEITEPLSEVSYDLRVLPPLALNSTQVRGILIDFMNHTKSDEHNRLTRLLKRMNTSEEEFLDRMKEIDSNPLTKRLILLLISECGATVGKDLDAGVVPNGRQEAHEHGQNVAPKTPPVLQQLVHSQLSEDHQDARALQLLNSLYTIASRFGKKR